MHLGIFEWKLCQEKEPFCDSGINKAQDIFRIVEVNQPARELVVGSRSNQHVTDACEPQCHEVTIVGCFGIFVVYDVRSTVRGN